VRAFYSDHFVLPLPAGHRFPMAKYRALRDQVAAELQRVQLTEAEAINDGELALAHDPDYIERVLKGRLTAAEQRAIGFPWTPQMVERSRRSSGRPAAGCPRRRCGRPSRRRAPTRCGCWPRGWWPRMIRGSARWPRP
jgi:acetoin utilization deacetylase AcuC-like enzyme